MDLVSAFKEQCVSINSSAADKQSLLREIAAVAKKAPVLEGTSEDRLFEALVKREALGSTGFQNGIAIPHCLLPDVPEFVVGLITHRQGVDFKSLDKSPTHIIPFIVGPRSERTTHIRILSAISRILGEESVRKELLAADTPTALTDSFLRSLGDTLSNKESPKRNLILITVQDEELFPDLLQLLSEEDDCHVSVIDAHDSSEYLNALPLFAAFWNENKKGFHRIIAGSVRHTLANELLRRIDTLAGGIKQKRGVMVQMMDVLYSEGNLDI